MEIKFNQAEVSVHQAVAGTDDKSVQVFDLPNLQPGHRRVVAVRGEFNEAERRELRRAILHRFAAARDGVPALSSAALEVVFLAPTESLGFVDAKKDAKAYVDRDPRPLLERFDSTKHTPLDLAEGTTVLVVDDLGAIHFARTTSKVWALGARGDGSGGHTHVVNAESPTRKFRAYSLDRVHLIPERAPDAPELPSPIRETRADAWARSFLEHARQSPSLAFDEGALIGWFANAMMRAHDDACRPNRVEWIANSGDWTRGTMTVTMHGRSYEFRDVARASALSAGAVELRVVLVEAVLQLACPRFAHGAPEHGKGECPDKFPGRFANGVNARFADAEWSDAEIDYWVANCQPIDPVDEHDHRFAIRFAVARPATDDLDTLNVGDRVPLAMSHYEATLKRTKNPRRFTDADQAADEVQA